MPSPNIVVPASTDPDATVAIGSDINSIRVFVGVGIHVVAAAAGVVVVNIVIGIVTILYGAFVARIFVFIGFRCVNIQVAIESAVTDDVAAVVANNSADVVVVVRHVARHAAKLNDTIILAADAAHLGIARSCPFGAHIGAHPAVLYLAVVLAADAAYQSRRLTADFAGHMEVLYLSAGANLFKQSLIVVGDFRDVDADGVAVAVEQTCESITTQWSPLPAGHVQVSIQLVPRRIIFRVIHKKFHFVVPVFTDVGQFGSRINVDDFFR